MVVASSRVVVGNQGVASLEGVEGGDSFLRGNGNRANDKLVMNCWLIPRGGGGGEGFERG